ncbi:MAG TPA: hypothetical protein VFT22_16825, partial [Kofleriaceae bacterium]|nr:hypothetical protein [Kofleriaceae bacterium]
MTDVCRLITSTLVWALAACSSGGTSGSEISSSEVTTYEELATQVSGAAASYQASMMDAHMTLASCAGVHDQYDQQVRPLIARMMSSGGEMDSFMSAHHGGGVADVACSAAAMMQELDAHARQACGAASIEDDRAEVARHVAAMTGFDDHVGQRCREIQAGLDGQGWSWASMMDGCSGGMMDGGGWMMDGGG